MEPTQTSSLTPVLIAAVDSEQESSRVKGNGSDRTAHFLVGHGLIYQVESSATYSPFSHSVCFFSSSNTCYYARIQIFNSRHFWHSSTCLLCQWGRPSLLNNAALFVPNSSLEPGGDHKKVSKKQSGGPLSSSWIDPSLLQKKCYAHKAHCGNPIILLMLLPMTICF